jgi:hypothetical protein
MWLAQEGGSVERSGHERGKDAFHGDRPRQNGALPATSGIPSVESSGSDAMPVAGVRVLDRGCETTYFDEHDRRRAQQPAEDEDLRGVGARELSRRVFGLLSETAGRC